MNVYSWLAAAVGPLAIRVVASLGFTAVTYTGVTVAIDSLLTMAQNNWSALPVSLLQFLTLSGIPQVMGMIFGAYMARIAMSAASSASKFIKTS